MSLITLNSNHMDRFNSINGTVGNYTYSTQLMCGEYHTVINDSREIVGTDTYHSKMCANLTAASKFLNDTFNSILN